MALGADPEFRKVMKAHGWMAVGADQTVSKDARQFLKEMIDRALLPRPEAPERTWRPYRALVLTYLEQHSHFTVARLLGLSSRQGATGCPREAYSSALRSRYARSQADVRGEPRC